MTIPTHPWQGAPLLLSIAVILVAYAALFTTAELLRRRHRVAPDLTRGLVHVVGALLAIPVPLLLGRPLGVALAVGLSGLQVWSRRRHVLMSIHGVDRGTYGEVALPLGIALLALAVQQYAAFAFGVVVLALADPCAGLVGRRHGRPIPGWPGQASLAGSGTFLAITCGVAAVFSAFVLDLPMRPMAIIASGLGVTLVESLVGRGLDNLVIPIVATAAYFWMFSV